MGIWGFGLYNNDSACDIKETYKTLLEKKGNYEEAYNSIFEMFHDYIGTDEEPIYWYAIADFQWHMGVLLPEVKEYALKWIEKNGGIDLWDGNEKGRIKWEEMLTKLKSQLNSPMPPVKKIRKPKDFVRNPWNVGDVYVYQFHSEESKEIGLYGKYVAIQKIRDDEWVDNIMCSRIQVFDKIFDSIPKLSDIDNVSIFPYDNIERFLSQDNITVFSLEDFIENDERVIFPLCLNLLMIRDKYSDYKEKYFEYIGNMKDKFNYPIPCIYRSNYYWDEFESCFCFYYNQWKKHDYEIYEDSFVIDKYF